MKKNKILILTAFWQRAEISEIFWLGIDRLKWQFDVKVAAIVSDDENKKLAIKNADIIIECENRPLGLKMNTGLKEVMNLDFDYMMQMGSDNLISNRAVKVCEIFYAAQRKFFGFNELYMINAKTKDVKAFKYGCVFGAGRCISRDLLIRCKVDTLIRMTESLSDNDVCYPKGMIRKVSYKEAKTLEERGLSTITAHDEVNYNLWPDEINSALDNNSERKIESFGLMPLIIPFKNPQIIDIKSATNISKWDKFENNHSNVGKLKPAKMRDIRPLISEKECDAIHKLR